MRNERRNGTAVQRRGRRERRGGLGGNDEIRGPNDESNPKFTRQWRVPSDGTAGEAEMVSPEIRSATLSLECARQPLHVAEFCRKVVLSHQCVAVTQPPHSAASPLRQVPTCAAMPLQGS